MRYRNSNEVLLLLFSFLHASKICLPICWLTCRYTHPECTLVQNSLTHKKSHFLSSLGVIEWANEWAQQNAWANRQVRLVERMSEASSAEQSNEWAWWANGWAGGPVVTSLFFAVWNLRGAPSYCHGKQLQLSWNNRCCNKFGTWK